MYIKKGVTIAAIATMLLATTIISTMSTTENAFAYSKKQAKSDLNDCGNGELPLNIGCQNTDSQIQGDRNEVAMTSSQVFGQDGNGPTPPPPGECEACFETLNLQQLQALAAELEDQFDIDFPNTSTREAIIDTICEALIEGPPDGLTVGNVNAAMAQLNDVITIDERQEVRDCLREIF
jgi:hypothetical protein